MKNSIGNLTPRQLDIIRLIANGNSYKQTGSLLSISVNTVRKHVNNACLKIGVDTRMQLVMAWANWQATQNKK